MQHSTSDMQYSPCNITSAPYRTVLLCGAVWPDCQQTNPSTRFHFPFPVLVAVPVSSQPLQPTNPIGGTVEAGSEICSDLDSLFVVNVLCCTVLCCSYPACCTTFLLPLIFWSGTVSTNRHSHSHCQAKPSQASRPGWKEGEEARFAQKRREDPMNTLPRSLKSQHKPTQTKNKSHPQENAARV